MSDAECSLVDRRRTRSRHKHRLQLKKASTTIGRVTDLFLVSAAGGVNAEQLELFDNVLERLIKTIEIRALADVSARMALAEISVKLAPVPKAPPAAIRRLAGK